MKKITITVLRAVATMALWSCTKEKDCVCSVEGKQEIRRFHLNDGDCIDIRYINDGNGKDEIRVFCMEDTLR